jgi:hypothetical protein
LADQALRGLALYASTTLSADRRRRRIGGIFAGLDAVAAAAAADSRLSSVTVWAAIWLVPLALLAHCSGRTMC